MGVELEIRPAAEADCGLLFDWANDPRVREMSFSAAEMRYETHEAWFASKLADPGSRLYVVSDRAGGPVGLVRFELDERGRWELGVIVAPGRRGQGLAWRVIEAGCGALREEFGGVAIRARTRPENRPFIRAAGRAGFAVQGPVLVRGQEAVLMVLPVSSS